MPAQPSVTGPGHIFVGLGTGKAPLYLGTSEMTPRIEVRPSYTKYFNSVFSPTVPMDMLYNGEEGLVFADLNRKDEDVFRLLTTRPRPVSGAVRGTNVVGDHGTMILYEGFAIPLWIQFPYAAKAAMSKIPKGFRFFNCVPLGPDSYEGIGMENLKNRLVMYAINTVAFGVGNMTTSTLFDDNMTGLPAVS